MLGYIAAGVAVLAIAVGMAYRRSQATSGSSPFSPRPRREVGEVVGFEPADDRLSMNPVPIAVAAAAATTHSFATTGAYGSGPAMSPSAARSARAGRVARGMHYT